MFDLGSLDLAGVSTALAGLPRDLTDAQRVDLLDALEGLKDVASAAQATLAVDLDVSQRAAHVAAGVPRRRVGDGVAAQVGLARRESPWRGAQLLSLARVLHTDLPHTLEQMRAGLLSERRAALVARGTEGLDPGDRRTVDERLCGPGGTAPALSDRALEQAVRREALALDVAAVVARAAHAETERHVTIRPAPDTMTWVGALLPVKDGVALHAALVRAADAARADGDPRGRGQVMADTLVERVTGASVAEPARVTLGLLMSDRDFLHGGGCGATGDAAHLPGHGPVPVPWAQDVAAAALDAGRLWVRRLYTVPGTGQLVAMDSTARLAPRGLARFVRRRDGDVCRTPWCGARISQVDHVTEWQRGGRTTATNTQGLCARCNLAKQAPGWRATTVALSRHTVETVTPTGHVHRSRAPAAPGGEDYLSPLETRPLTLELGPAPPPPAPGRASAPGRAPRGRPRAPSPG